MSQNRNHVSLLGKLEYTVGGKEADLEFKYLEEYQILN